MLAGRGLLLVALLGCRAAPGEPGVWTKRNSSEINLTTIAWSGSQFVAIGCCSVLTSPDGLKWTRAVQEAGYGPPAAGSMPYQWQLESVVWAGSQFVAVGRVVGQAEPLQWDRALIATSPDGVTWTEQSVPDSGGKLLDVAWSGRRFVAVGSVVLTSIDGVTWSAVRTPMPFNDNWPADAVTWGGSQFVVLGGKAAMTSRDGVKWIERKAIHASEDVTWSGDRFVAVGNDLPLTSPDGVTWSSHPSPLGAYGWRAVTWGDSQFVAVGSAGIMTSPDGMTWTEQVAPVGTYADVIWSGTRFVAVGEFRKGWFADYTVGLIVTSP